MFRYPIKRAITLIIDSRVICNKYEVSQRLNEFFLTDKISLFYSDELLHSPHDSC